MQKLIAALTLFSALTTSALAEPNWPAEILIGTEPTSAAEFKAWSSEDATKFAGTYAGDVGGDSGGKLTVKVTSKAGEIPILLSGTYTLTTAGSTPSTVKFDNIQYYGEDGPSFNGFSLSFVKLGAASGVIVGNIFLKKE